MSNASFAIDIRQPQYPAKPRVENHYLYSSIPATWIDGLLVENPNFWDVSTFSKFRYRATSLIISVTVFPLFLAFDLVRYGAKTLVHRCHAIVNPEAKAHAEKCGEIAFKCLKGFAATPTGLIWRDIVSNHFLPEKRDDGKIHPTGGLYESAAEIRTPDTIEEVASIVREARARGKKISIGGAGYSQGKQILPNRENDFHIDMSGINHIRIDRERKVATVGAGATWKDLQNEANSQALAVQVMQASNVFSIGGSLSANCHGWDHKMGSLGNTVLSITIINAQGELQVLRPQDELFGYVLGGYGMFGVIVEAELQLADNEELFEYAEKVDLNDYANYFNQRIQPNPYLRMHLCRLSLEPGKLLSEGYAQSYSAKDGALSSEHLVDEPDSGRSKDKILMQVARNSRFARGLWWKQEVKNMLKVSQGRRNDVMRPPILAAFASNSKAKAEWLQEYFVPGEHLAEFIRFLGATLDKNDVALLNASIRFVKKDERAKLGYAVDGDRFAIVLFFTQALNKNEVEKTKNWVQAVVNRLTEIGGTFYLPYMHFATQEQFRECYPAWEDVDAKKRQYDPQGLFDNGLYQDYFRGNV